MPVLKITCTSCCSRGSCREVAHVASKPALARRLRVCSNGSSAASRSLAARIAFALSWLGRAAGVRACHESPDPRNARLTNTVTSRRAPRPGGTRRRREDEKAKSEKGTSNKNANVTSHHTNRATGGREIGTAAHAKRTRCGLYGTRALLSRALLSPY